MTPGERKALLFLAGIGVLGAGARLASAPAHEPSRAERAALAGQMQAVDSARGAGGDRASSSRHAGRARRDTSAAPRGRKPPRVRVEAPPAPNPPAIVDLDADDSTAIETLPGIGPALAARIVADRAAHGAFGGLAGLQQVRGVGPKLAARVAPLVTFSGAPRPVSPPARRP